MERRDPRRRRLDKRNDRTRRRRAELALTCPEEATKRRAKDAERKRFKRSAARRPHATRHLDDRALEQVEALSKYIATGKSEDFTASRCFNPTTLKWTTFLAFSDMERILSREQMFTDSIIDWHCSAVGEGLGVDRSEIRLMSCSTASLMFAAASNYERVRYDHLSKRERALSNPKSALEFSKLIFPVCIREHWVAVSVEPPTKTVQVFDSLQNNRARLKDIRTRFDRYIKTQGGGRTKYKTVQPKIPQQTNSIDCGVFVVDRIAALMGANDGEVMCVDQATVYHYRARMYLAALECMHMHIKG